MKCEECGRDFHPSHRGSPSKYCCGACRAKAYRKRRKQQAKAPAKRDAPTPAAAPTPSAAPRLNGREFDRMMDGSLEDDLRHVRDRLKRYLDDPSTPANAIANISARYIIVCERLHDLAGGDPLLDIEDETSEVSDVGASIV
ncbi:hypothetical protein [Bifidobacterium scardovii]|uniref:Uncharacterized protein n=1 Tax=Bifidobacterium scardovii TaxID=158787 RepID=A0A087D420_9BIFI|nr:hypothetical protein [Bifidobacterium scardovii]KFI90270.1 hypothetical protein BSCA_1881 [Bifidobacterium scardovii]MDK6350045.1 hypothetical protein [Bifidobacterium scardovii]MDU8982166.1 hypothetical protein [Bifidobacterium scardovii]